MHYKAINNLNRENINNFVRCIYYIITIILDIIYNNVYSSMYII